MSDLLPGSDAAPPLKESHRAVLRTFYNLQPQKMTSWSYGYRKLLADYYNEMIPEDASVLEVGCGDGSLLALLKGSHKAGIDLSEKQIEAARCRLPEAHFEVVACEDYEPSRTYDVIILSDTLNQSEDCQLLLQRLKKAAHPGTRMMGNIYNTLWRPAMSFLRWMGLAASVPADNWLSTDDIGTFLNLSDWEIIRMYGKLLWPVSDFAPAQWINRWWAPFFPWLSLTLFFVARPGKFKMDPLPSLSIVIPARNEAGNIEAAVLRVPEMSPQQEWIFVEGGSRDATWEKIEEVKLMFPEKRIKIVKQSGTGKANAVREGFAQAEGEILMILDADLTMPPEELPKFFEAIVKGRAEFANGVRLVYPMDNQAMPFLNLCANKFFAILFTWLIEQPVKDTLCGTKVLTKANYERIVRGRAHFGDFDPFGDFDLLFGAARINLKIADIPIRYKDRTYGQTNISRWRHGAILLRMAAFGAAKLKFI